MQLTDTVFNCRPCSTKSTTYTSHQGPGTHVVTFGAPGTHLERPQHSRIPGSIAFWSWLHFNYTQYTKRSLAMSAHLNEQTDSPIYSPSPTEGGFSFAISPQQFLQYFRKERLFFLALFSCPTLHKQTFKSSARLSPAIFFLPARIHDRVFSPSNTPI